MTRKPRIVEQAAVRFRGVAEVARRCGVSHSHISAVLHGRREASPSLSRRLARLGIDAAAFAPAK